MRLLRVLLSSLSCAAIAAIAAVWVAASTLPSAGAGELRTAELALETDARAVRSLLAFSCERDAQIERLLLELSAGATQVDADAVVRPLERALEGQVDLYLEQSGALRTLAGQGLANLALLRAAAKSRVASEASADARLFDACSRTQVGRRVWLLRSAKLDSVLQAAGLSPTQFRVGAVDASAARHTLARLSAAPGSALALTEVAHETAMPIGIVLICVGAAAALGALLGLMLTRGEGVDESVLATLEEATARVAQGDLSSQIGPRVGGRADQTFRSFDRMTAELREMRAKLAEAERSAAWQDMAQRIAHEIKNPLSPIRMALETMRKAHARRLPAFDEIFDESTRAMLEEVQRMEHIVHEFSAFARLPKAKPGAMSLAAVLQETARLYIPDNVDMSVSLPEAERPIHADREQLTQVLSNLISNAVHAARTLPSPRVQLTLQQTSEASTLYVDDNGPGVPAAERERIFEPYVTGREGGTGLGLAIARRIAHDHGGTLVAGDSPLGGARFTLRLPDARA